MIRVNIVVEGQTEEGFVKRVIRPHLRRQNTHVNPILIPNKSGVRAREKRGGILSYSPVRRFVRRKVTDDTEAYTTTLFDYYGLPSNFPGYSSEDCPPPARTLDRVEYLEGQFAADIGDTRRFIPYFQLHEFEALLFSEVETLDREIRSLQSSSRSRRHFLRIVQRFDNPEHINDDPETAPSKRILNHYPGYQKNPFGELIAESIGLDTIRNECPRFDGWLTRLETLDPLDS